MSKRILIVFQGTRGDFQPYIVASKALKTAGYEVLTAGNEDAAGLAESFGMPFRAVRENAQETYTSARWVEALNGGDFGKILECQSETETDEIRRRAWDSTYKTIQEFQPDLVLSGFVNLPYTLCCCFALRVPVLLFALQRSRPSRYLPTFGILKMPQGILQTLTWDLATMAMIRGQRQDNGPFIEEIMQRPVLDVFPTQADWMDFASCDPVFCSLVSESAAIHGDFPPDFTSNVVRLGPMMSAASDQRGSAFGGEMQPALESFLAKGAAPVFFGFGSMICKNSKYMTLLCLRALKLTGLRGILNAAWSEMSAELIDGEPDAEELKAYCKEKVLFVKYAAHGSLFPRCSVIVHHGGAGTTNASARSGTPTVVLPISLDQFDHARRVDELGIGVATKAMGTLEPQEVADAVVRCVEDSEIHKRARQVAEDMAKENGPAELVAFVDKYMKEFVDTGRHLKLQDDQVKKNRTSALWGWLPCCG